MKTTHALILAHGEMPSPEVLARLRAEADLFIATDGAANALPDIGATPDVVLGDFDSLSPRSRTALPGAEFVDAWDQEASDLDKAIAYAHSRGADRVTVTGALGGRLDHTLTSISLLIKYHETLDICIVEAWGEARTVHGTAEFHGAPGDSLSLICFASVGGVTVTGVKWPLRDETLHPGSRGVSNRFETGTVLVTVRTGILIVVHLAG